MFDRQDETRRDETRQRLTGSLEIFFPSLFQENLHRTASCWHLLQVIYPP